MSRPVVESPAASTRESRRRLGVAAAIIALGLIAGVVYLRFPWRIPPAASFTVVAHRGVHQTFPLTDLTNETCTVAIIDPPTHAYSVLALPIDGIKTNRIEVIGPLVAERRAGDTPAS